MIKHSLEAPSNFPRHFWEISHFFPLIKKTKKKTRKPPQKKSGTRQTQDKLGHKLASHPKKKKEKKSPPSSLIIKQTKQFFSKNKIK
jgi:hypothetical protein